MLLALFVMQTIVLLIDYPIFVLLGVSGVNMIKRWQ
jgi:hypothetical protein